MNQLEIRKIIEIDASPEIVFEALTNSESLTQWFPDQALLEPKVGGKVKFTFFSRGVKPLDRDFYPEGEIVEFVPNKKLVYTWIPSDIPNFPKTVVSWSLKQIGKNKTLVTLTHSGFSGKPHELYSEHKHGWDYFAKRLVEYCKK
jgi:uncharacterized protein YndB with AHSA1/START domain